jgi:hypothetical protein
MIKLVRPCHLFIEVPVPHQKSVPSCIYVLRVSNSPLSTIFLFDLGTVQDCGMFCSLYMQQLECMHI